MLYQEENPPTKFVQIDTISRPVSITLFTHIRYKGSVKLFYNDNLIQHLNITTECPSNSNVVSRRKCLSKSVQSNVRFLLHVLLI